MNKLEKSLKLYREAMTMTDINKADFVFKLQSHPSATRAIANVVRHQRCQSLKLLKTSAMTDK